MIFQLDNSLSIIYVTFYSPHKKCSNWSRFFLFSSIYSWNKFWQEEEFVINSLYIEDLYWKKLKYCRGDEGMLKLWLWWDIRIELLLQYTENSILNQFMYWSKLISGHPKTWEIVIITDNQFSWNSQIF